MGKDHTLFSLIDGLVKFEKYGPDKKKVKVCILAITCQHLLIIVSKWFSVAFSFTGKCLPIRETT